MTKTPMQGKAHPNSQPAKDVPTKDSLKDSLIDPLQDSAQPSDAGPVCDGIDEIVILKQQNEELVNMLKRVQAEFENFKKRSEKENARAKEVSAMHLVEKILPVIDSFESALRQAEMSGKAANSDAASNSYNSAHHNSAHSSSANLAGMKLVHSQINSILEKEGLRKINALGKKFDPNYHEVLMMECCPDAEEDIITKELQPGYMFRNVVLRTSKICINKKEQQK